MTGSILVVSRAVPHHHTGGMETMVWSLASEWARTGLAVTVLTTALPGVSGSFVQDGVTVVPLHRTAPGRYSAAWWRETRAFWRDLPAAPGAVLSVSAGGYGIVRDRRRHPRTPFVLQAHGSSMMEIAS